MLINYKLKEPSVILCIYTRKIPLLVEITATVEYEDQVKTLSLVVIEGSRPALLGQDWLH